MSPGECVTIDAESQARVAAEQLFERDTGFEPGKRRPQAVVDPMAEAEVRAVAAGEVEYVRRREANRIAVGRADSSSSRCAAPTHRPARCTRPLDRLRIAAAKSDPVLPSLAFAFAAE
jgi:hypothetical protein